MIKESVEHAHSKTECIDRDTLVYAMEHSGKVQIGRKLEWGKSETPDSEARERLGVGASGQAVRNDPGSGILSQEGTGHGVDQIAVERSLERDIVMDEIPL